MRRIVACAAFALICLPLVAAAQALVPLPTPSELPPEPGWAGSFSAGLALTQGNSDTSTVNLALNVLRNTGSSIPFKSSALFIRSDADGERNANRLAFDARADRKFTERTSLYTQLQYLDDEFKEIDYLVSPTLGVGHFLVKNERTTLAIDSGVGVVWEKNPGEDLNTNVAITAGQNFKHRLTATTEVTQRASALWTADDFGDSLYLFGAGVAASITTQTQLKVEVLNTLKNRPPSDTVQKNDVAILVSFVYKF